MKDIEAILICRAIVSIIDDDTYLIETSEGYNFIFKDYIKPILKEISNRHLFKLKYDSHIKLISHDSTIIYSVPVGCPIKWLEECKDTIPEVTILDKEYY
jgi:predicted proteasome-type protease